MDASGHAATLGSECEPVNLALELAGRLHRGARLSELLLAVRIAASADAQPQAVLGLVERLDDGARAAGVLDRPARGRCFQADRGGCALVVPVHAGERALRGLWVRALARTHPDCEFSLVAAPTPDRRATKQVEAAERLETRYGALAHPACRNGTREPRGRLRLTSEQALRRAEYHGARARRLKLDSLAPLLDALAAGRGVLPLPPGAPLAERFLAEEFPDAYLLLGERAAIGDLASLSDGALSRLGFGRADRQRLRAAADQQAR